MDHEPIGAQPAWLRADEEASALDVAVTSATA